jgi:3D (Asp-Asp-Asp) domain-containing protein
MYKLLISALLALYAGICILIATIPIYEREPTYTTAADPVLEPMASVRIYVPDEHKPIGLKPHPTETPERMTGSGQAEADPAEPVSEWTSLGVFRITHYCLEPYTHICGSGHGITSTGNQAIPYRTVSVDPEVIPQGSILMLAGCDREYIADDTGGWIKGNRIDKAVVGHVEALEAGVVWAEVFIRRQSCEKKSDKS